MERLGFSLYTRLNMTSGTILHKCLRSSIYYKNRLKDDDDGFQVNMYFSMQIISYFVSSLEKIERSSFLNLWGLCLYVSFAVQSSISIEANRSYTRI